MALKTAAAQSNVPVRWLFTFFTCFLPYFWFGLVPLNEGRMEIKIDVGMMSACVRTVCKLRCEMLSQLARSLYWLLLLLASFICVAQEESSCSISRGEEHRLTLFHCVYLYYYYINRTRSSVYFGNYIPLIAVAAAAVVVVVVIISRNNLSFRFNCLSLSCN